MKKQNINKIGMKIAYERRHVRIAAIKRQRQALRTQWMSQIQNTPWNT
jgi:hypothetical protein